MASPSDNLIYYIRRLAVPASRTEASDSALLGRYIASGDERAFAALVERHCALVLQVCWRILENSHDAQDAFQATFLVLARKAAAVRPPEALPAWLHGVARRVALKIRSTRLRHRRAERPLAATTMDSHPDPLAELATRDFLAIIDEEVRRLAEVYRLPVILCCLEGRSIEEAAQQLGWTVGSVKGRLERGRARLHERLVRRGLTLSAALAAVELSRCAASATVAARQAVVSAQAVAVAQSIIKSMALAKLKTTAALMLATCLLVGGLLARRQAHLARMTDPDVSVSASPTTNLPKSANPAIGGENEKSPVREETADRIDVSGRVLGPDGRPLAGAKLYVGYAPRRSEPDAVAHLPIYPVRANSGADGRFHFTFARSDLDERYLDASRPVVMATANGFGLDWAEIGGSPAVAVNLRLVEDFPLEGHVLDAERNPVAGAKVLVREVSSDSMAKLKRYIEQLESDSATLKTCWGPLPGQPPQVTTAADGRFRLTGLGRDRLVMLAIEGPGILSTQQLAMTRPAADIPPGLMRPGGVPLECVAALPRSIRGGVRDKKTGQGVPGVKVSLQRSNSSTYTDKAGRYELLVPPELREYIVLAQPQNGQPYFAAAARPPHANGLPPLTADFELIDGISVRGRVTDQTTGKPPKRAVVEYYPLFPNAHSSVLTRLEHLQAESSATVQADGAYSLTVLPGPGVVIVAASPRDFYATAVLDARELAKIFPRGGNYSSGSWLHIAVAGGLARRRCVDRYNALALIQPDEKAKFLTLDLTVQPARPLRGIVVGPDGEPLNGVSACGLTSMPDAERLDSTSFLVEGLNPRLARNLSFHHKEKGLGKFLTIRGDETKELRVQLEPCGVVIGRIVDRSGKPAPGVAISFHSGGNGLHTQVETDRQGRFRTALVPGLSYQWGTSLRLSKPASALTLESGQTKDLGDLLLNN